MQKVRWGILSTAKIGTEKVIPAMQRGERAEVVAIASRDAERAKQFASKLGIARAYSSYDELLNDQEVDAVYNPLPNHLHVCWSIKAIEAGKHVLCEKPLGLSSIEAQRLVDVAAAHPYLKVMEAFMYRHHPQWQKAKEWALAKKIGDVTTIQSFFSYHNTDPKNIRNQADMGGGGLMDIGCYNISLSRFIFGGEPHRVVGFLECDPTFGTDRLATAIMVFDGGTSAFTCSTQLAPYQRVNLFGATGRIEIEIPFNAPPDRPCRMWHQGNGTVDEWQIETCDQYTIQGDLMSQAILDDRPVPTPLIDGVANMRVIEAIVASSERGEWVDVNP